MLVFATNQATTEMESTSNNQILNSILIYSFDPFLSHDNNGECADINECHANPCSGPTSSCENLPGSHQCFCGEGYELDDTDSVCVDIDECLTLGQCMMGQCWNTQGSFDCCTTTTHDFNELTGECTLKDPCEDLNCDSGYECEVTNTLLNEAECVDIDECDRVNTCSEVEECRNTDGSYSAFKHA